MAYTKHIWVDKEDIAFDPATDPKLEAENLNEMEDGIASSDSHTTNQSNPHGVTKAQVGLGNVDNTSDLSKPISTATQNALDDKEDHLGTPTADGQILTGYISGVRAWEAPAVQVLDHFNLLNIGTNTHVEIDTHIGNKVNPHEVTKHQVGLGEVDNTSDLDKPISTATQTALDLKEDDLGQATLDGQVLTGYTNGNMEWLNPITGVTDHLFLTNIGLHTHDQIDAHINSDANPHQVTPDQIGAAHEIHNHTESDIVDLDKYTQAEVDVALALKADITYVDDEIATRVPQTSVTGSATLPVGTTAQRDVTPTNGMIRYNADDDSFEGYANSAWGAIGGGGSGGEFSMGNKIINGGFDIWQRGTSFTSNGYTADRWYAENANVSWSSYGDSTKADVTATGIYAHLYQKIEDGWKLKGKQVTLSFFWEPVSDCDDAYVYVNMESGARIGVGEVPNPTVVGQKSMTFNVPNDGNVWDYLEIRIYLNGGTLDFSRVHISKVQLEEGSVATPFEQRPIGMELSLCQRYYYRLDNSVNASAYICAASIYNSSNMNSMLITPMNMRVYPSLSVSDISHFQSIDTGTIRNLKNITLSAPIGADNRNIALSWGGSGLPSGNSAFIRFDGTAGAFIELDAEL